MWYVMTIFFPFMIMETILFETIGITSPWLVSISLTNLVLVNKDVIGGRSVAKRAYGYALIDKSSKEEASPFQCMIRNVTFLFWPVEAVAVMISPKRRIGDLIANTELIECSISEPSEILDEMKNQKFTLSALLAIIISVLFILFWDHLFSSFPLFTWLA